MWRCKTEFHHWGCSDVETFELMNSLAEESMAGAHLYTAVPHPTWGRTVVFSAEDRDNLDVSSCFVGT